MTDEHLKNLGRVAANFQALELRIAFWTWGLIGEDQAVGRMVTAQLPFGKLCVLADSLFEHRAKDHPSRSRFAGVIWQSLKAEEQRNQLFHSAWLSAPESGEISRLKSSLKLDRGLVTTSPAVTADEIGRLADAIRALVGELDQMTKEVPGIATWPTVDAPAESGG
jgi:hypothetical protein